MTPEASYRKGPSGQAEPTPEVRNQNELELPRAATNTEQDICRGVAPATSFFAFFTRQLFQRQFFKLTCILCDACFRPLNFDNVHQVFFFSSCSLSFEVRFLDLNQTGGYSLADLRELWNLIFNSLLQLEFQLTEPFIYIRQFRQ